MQSKINEIREGFSNLAAFIICCFIGLGFIAVAATTLGCVMGLFFKCATFGFELFS